MAEETKNVASFPMETYKGYEIAISSIRQNSDGTKWLVEVEIKTDGIAKAGRSLPTVSGQFDAPDGAINCAYEMIRRAKVAIDNLGHATDSSMENGNP